MPGKKCLADLYSMKTVSAANIAYVAVLVCTFLKYLLLRLPTFIFSVVMSSTARSHGLPKTEGFTLIFFIRTYSMYSMTKNGQRQRWHGGMSERFFKFSPLYTDFRLQAGLQSLCPGQGQLPTEE